MSFLPPDLLDSLSDVPGFNRDTFIRVHDQGEAVTSVRLNPGKITGELPFSHTRKIPWSQHGLYLPERPSFTLDPFFHAGMYYVQEASSMFLEQALIQSLDLSKTLRVLDLCASPGGKSTHILSLISNDSFLVSNEIIRSRAGILEENIIKWGTANAVVTSNDPADFQALGHFFDCIVADAPCSGSGLFRKDPEAVSEWSVDAVNLCSQRQQRILADVLSCLKPGGILVYSTCSYSVEEDEQIADWLTEEWDMESVPLSVPSEWNIIQTQSPQHQAFGYRFYPDKLDGEGFFMAVFRKKMKDREIRDQHTRRGKTSKTAWQMANDFGKKMIAPWIHLPEEHVLYTWQDMLLLMPRNLGQAIPELQSALYLKKAGTELGTLIRDEFIPSHALAMSVHRAKELPSWELNLEQALQYLRRAELASDEIRKGWALVRFRDVSLGWVKLLSNRVNNYYPREWRILNK